MLDPSAVPWQEGSEDDGRGPRLSPSGGVREGSGEGAAWVGEGYSPSFYRRGGETDGATPLA
jgi:hypothetical protein